LLWTLGVHNLKAVRILLDLGADSDKYTLTKAGEVGLGPASWIASGVGQIEVLQTLLDHGANPNLIFGNESLLMRAVGWQHLECADLLLQRGADINLSVGPMSALSQTLVQVQFGDAIWVLSHGYTHDAQVGRRMLARKNPRPGEEELKEWALEIIDRLITEQDQGH
jgi:ankyrin repeat protein